MITDSDTSLKTKLLSSNYILFYFAAFKFILLIIFAGNYGLFRDEFYYLVDPEKVK